MKKVNSLTFLKKTNKKDKHGLYYWVAKCNCGAVIESVPARKKVACDKCVYDIRSNRNKKRSLDRLEKIKIDLSFSPENMYFWGFLWADGYIRNNAVRIALLSTDMIDILPIVPDYFSRYNIQDKSKTRNCKPQTTIILNHKTYYDFLINNGYDLKEVPDEKMLNNKYSYLWYRGLIDGDGCWYFNKKNHCRQFNIASNYDQDWSFFEKLCLNLNIKYSLTRRIAKNGNKHSVIRICNKGDIKTLYEYLYQDYCHIGLKRKFEKVKDLIK